MTLGLHFGACYGKSDLTPIFILGPPLCAIRFIHDTSHVFVYSYVLKINEVPHAPTRGHWLRPKIIPIPTFLPANDGEEHKSTRKT